METEEIHVQQLPVGGGYDGLIHQHTPGSQHQKVTHLELDHAGFGVQGKESRLQAVKSYCLFLFLLIWKEMGEGEAKLSCRVSQNVMDLFFIFLPSVMCKLDILFSL